MGDNCKSVTIKISAFGRKVCLGEEFKFCNFLKYVYIKKYVILFKN